MRNFVVVTLSFAGVIALLDVSASFALNGTVAVPVLLVLVALIVQHRAPRVDPRDLVTLLRLRQRAAALERHTRVLRRAL